MSNLMNNNSSSNANLNQNPEGIGNSIRSRER